MGEGGMLWETRIWVPGETCIWETHGIKDAPLALVEITGDNF